MFLAESEDLQPQLATEASLTPHKLPHNVQTSVEWSSAEPKPSRVQISGLDVFFSYYCQRFAAFSSNTVLKNFSKQHFRNW